MLKSLLRVVERARHQFVGDAQMRPLLRTSGLVFGVRVVAAGAGYLGIMLLARWMGAAEYGVYAFALAWPIMLALPAGLGLPGAAVRFIPEYQASDDWGSIRGLLRRSTVITIVIGGAIALAGVGSVAVLGDRIAPVQSHALAIALCGVPLLALVELSSQVARGFGWAVLSTAPVQLLRPVVVVGIAAALLVSGERLTAPKITAAALGAFATMLLVQGLVIARRAGPRLASQPRRYDTGHWVRVALPYLLIGKFAILISELNLIVVGALTEPREVAFFHAALRSAVLVNFGLQALNVLTAPTVADLHARGQRAELQRLLSKLAHWILWPSLAIAGGMWLLGARILSFFGPGFEAGYVPLAILIVGALAQSAGGATGSVLNMTGHQDLSAKILAGGAAVNVALGVALIPRYGIVGAAIALAVARVIWNGALLVAVVRRVGVYPSLLWPPPRAIE